MHVPFLIGAVAFPLAIAVLATGHRLLAEAERADKLDEAGPPTRADGTAVGAVAAAAAGDTD